MNKIFNVLFLLVVLCISNVFPQNINKKIVYGILLDNTGSMRTQINDVKHIGKSVVEEIISKGLVSILNFKTEGIGNSTTAQIYVGVKWNQNKEIISAYIDNLEVVTGHTSLFDGILLTAGIINSKAGSENEKVLILVTDGEDRISITKEKDLIEFLKEKKIKVYAVGLIKELSSEMGLRSLSPQTKAKEFLKEITKETQGKAIFPNVKQKSDDVIKDLFVESLK